jgi:Flp pilus assembly pilin Flp
VTGRFSKREVISVFRLVEFFRGLIRREEGQTLTEYGLILFFIAIIAIVAVTALGERVSEIFDYITTELS